MDLTLSDPTIYLDYKWKTKVDNCGSDHYPMILERLEPELEEKNTTLEPTKGKMGTF